MDYVGQPDDKENGGESSLWEGNIKKSFIIVDVWPLAVVYLVLGHAAKKWCVPKSRGMHDDIVVLIETTLYLIVFFFLSNVYFLPPPLTERFG